MAIPLEIKKTGVRSDPKKPSEIGERARCERDRLLRDHPHLQAYQNEIDRLLEGAGSTQNRMAVLGLMMEAKLKELTDQLSLLKDCAQALERR